MQKEISPFTVLVSSCDGFSDTWEPFFHLYSENLILPEANLLLITERKEFTYPGLDIRCTRANRTRQERLTWAECVLDALDQIETELVFYVQDDYFIERPANSAAIAQVANRMIRSPQIASVALTHHSTQGPFLPFDGSEELPRLVEVSKKAAYRISLQAAMWRKECLKSYLVSDENAWMFEIFGTRRSSRRTGERLLSIAPEEQDLLTYTHTGIIKGRWHPAMPELFRAHGIPVDFSRRGFYEAPPRLLRKAQTFRKVLSSPGKMMRAFLGF
jgi:hypothetical protein